MENREGQRVPQVTLKTRQGSDWIDRDTDSYFAGKKVVVFSLPGAFTPTCSSSHVPRYNELAPIFKANGIDDVICVSVNDAFVMNEWQAQQRAWNITFMPDGTGEFTRGMGMLALLLFGPRKLPQIVAVVISSKSDCCSHGKPPPFSMMNHDLDPPEIPEMSLSQ